MTLHTVKLSLIPTMNAYWHTITHSQTSALYRWPASRPDRSIPEGINPSYSSHRTFAEPHGQSGYFGDGINLLWSTVQEIPRIPKYFEGVSEVIMGRDSSVGIATRYGLDGPGIESQLGGRRDFPHPSRSASGGPTQPPIQWVPGLSLGSKAAGVLC
jgi:hypothetical protein